jgi:hypothetical protein
VIGKGASYPPLTEQQQERFRDAVLKGGIDPKMMCPLCLYRRITVDARHRWDDESEDFVRSGTWVACHYCHVQYTVIHAREAA